MNTLPQLDGPRVPPASGKAPRQLVIFAHGYGSNGQDLIGLAPYFRQALPDAQFVSPNAPESVPGYMGGYQWWPLRTLSLEERAAGARKAGPVLDAFIDAELARYGLTEDRLALVGFSQGTMMSLHAGPRRERQIAGIVGFSGMLTDEKALEAELKTKPPVLLVHGDMDPVLPVQAFFHAKSVLERLGFDLTTHVSRGLGHSIDEAGMRLATDFLKRVLPSD
jgi:phospholipase/carboxylesterase